ANTRPDRRSNARAAIAAWSDVRRPRRGGEFLMRQLILLPLLLVGACKWTDFDDLADKTWVHSTDKPDIGSTDYGVAIVGVTTQASGGQLAGIRNTRPKTSHLV